MARLMRLHGGVGLAAPQIGVLSSVFIIKDNKHNVIEFINPKIISTDGTILLNEGCLSAPKIFLPIPRAESVHLEYQNLQGETKQVVAEGIEARAILHEYDHLQGKFYFDLVNRATRKAAISKLEKSFR
jgi:peptide deformylase